MEVLFTPFSTLLLNSNYIIQQGGKNDLQVKYRIFESLESLSIDKIDIEIYERREFVLFCADLGSDYEVRLDHPQLYQHTLKIEGMRDSWLPGPGALPPSKPYSPSIRSSYLR
jgi:hypothetical protein